MSLTKDQKQVTLTGLLLILLGVVILFACLQSCSPYKRIANDGNPTEKEKSLLAISCVRNFPPIKTTYNIDSVIKATSKDYTHQIDSLTNLSEILDSIIHEQIPIIDTVNVTDSNCLSRIKIAYQEISRLNSKLAVISNLSSLQKDQIQFLKSYEPCDSLRIATLVKAECDSAKNYVLLAQLRGKSDSLLIRTTQWKDARKSSKNWMWTAIALGVILAGGIALKIRSLFKPKI